MKLIARYLTIPMFFSLIVVSYALFTGKHNQANFFGLFVYGMFFYGAPFFVLALITWFFKASNQIIHMGFIGVSMALLLISSLWILPPDPSGLPVQWMMYWPLSFFLGLILIGASLVFNKYKTKVSEFIF